MCSMNMRAKRSLQKIREKSGEFSPLIFLQGGAGGEDGGSGYKTSEAQDF